MLVSRVAREGDTYGKQLGALVDARQRATHDERSVDKRSRSPIGERVCHAAFDLAGVCARVCACVRLSHTRRHNVARVFRIFKRESRMPIFFPNRIVARLTIIVVNDYFAYLYKFLKTVYVRIYFCYIYQCICMNMQNLYKYARICLNMQNYHFNRYRIKNSIRIISFIRIIIDCLSILHYSCRVFRTFRFYVFVKCTNAVCIHIIMFVLQFKNIFCINFYLKMYLSHFYKSVNIYTLNKLCTYKSYVYNILFFRNLWE